MSSKAENLTNQLEFAEKFVDEIIEDEWLLRAFNNESTTLNEYQKRWESKTSEILDQEHER